MAADRRMSVAWVEADPPSSFTELDRELLERHANIRRLPYPGRLCWSWLVQCVRAIRRSDAVYAFFAGEHAVVPFLVGRLLRRRLLLVPGGYDYADLPEHGYGLQARRWGFVARWLGRIADVALPISAQTEGEFLAAVPSAGSRTKRAYLPVDPGRWERPEHVRRDPDLVVTVGFVDEEAYLRKGIDRFVELAREDPARRYIIGGRVTQEVQQRIDATRPPNLETTGYLSHDELRSLFWSASVYAQLSWHETFGVAMAEAMLCGCVPLISTSPALQEVASDWAVVSPGAGGDLESLRVALARSADVDRAAMARDVEGRFSMAQRERDLLEALRADPELTEPVRAGWSRTAVPVTRDMLVLDLGSGAFPNPRADVLCDGELVDDRHRAGLPIVIDRPLVVADAGALPFKRHAFDFVIASHIAEHLPDPEAFCAELTRVARAGYIETPSPITDVLLHEEYHLWRVGGRAASITFSRKGQRSRLARWLSAPIYYVFNAGQPCCEGKVAPLPDNVVGRLARWALRAVNGTLARLGVLHTRIQFSERSPLRWSVR